MSTAGNKGAKKAKKGAKSKKNAQRGKAPRSKLATAKVLKSRKK